MSETKRDAIYTMNPFVDMGERRCDGPELFRVEFKPPQIWQILPFIG